MQFTYSPFWLYPLTVPLSAFYNAIVRLRHRFYDHRIFPTYNSPIPILSIGSITAGGAGKTPLSIWVIEELLKRNVKVGYLSKGYKRKSKNSLLISNGENLLETNPLICGDEALLVAKKYPNVCVLNDKDRVNGAHSLAELGCEVIVLDDGFQYRRLRKTLDWVILDTLLPKKSYRMLPLGYLRDSFYRLEKSNCIWLRVNHEKVAQDWIVNIRKFEGFSEIPIIPFQTLPNAVVNSKQVQYSLDKIKNRKVVAFAGIAHPNRFLQTLRALDCEIVGWFPFEDHTIYTEKKVQTLIQKFHSTKADYLLTTEKDFVKLPSFMHSFPIFALQIKIEVFGNREMINEQFQTLFRK